MALAKAKLSISSVFSLFVAQALSLSICGQNHFQATCETLLLLPARHCICAERPQRLDLVQFKTTEAALVTGGAGYSGGGFAANITVRGGGGSDGGDGLPEGLGGPDSGFDIASINIQSFQLKPGAGGEALDPDLAGGFFAGGVLVNGVGPLSCHFGVFGWKDNFIWSQSRCGDDRDFDASVNRQKLLDE